VYEVFRAQQPLASSENYIAENHCGRQQQGFMGDWGLREWQSLLILVEMLSSYKG
jgi:hypothetical protein